MFRACPQGWAELHFHLGQSTQHTVHEAELVGILLGLHLIKTDKKGRTSYSLGIDNQAAISALNVVKSSPGQYIADDILAAATQIKKSRNYPNYSLTFRWTAGHSGITGNEECYVATERQPELRLRNGARYASIRFLCTRPLDRHVTDLITRSDDTWIRDDGPFV